MLLFHSTWYTQNPSAIVHYFFKYMALLNQSSAVSKTTLSSLYVSTFGKRCWQNLNLNGISISYSSPLQGNRFSGFTSQGLPFSFRDHTLMRMYHCFMNFDIKKLQSEGRKFALHVGKNIRENLVEFSSFTE